MCLYVCVYVCALCKAASDRVSSHRVNCEKGSVVTRMQVAMLQLLFHDLARERL